MNDSYELDDLPCPACGNSVTHSCHCREFNCEDGSVDLYHDDPINESPGSYVACEECHGHGIERWCPHCGGDYWLAKARGLRDGSIVVCAACKGSGNGDDDECDECSGAGWVRVAAAGTKGAA